LGLRPSCRSQLLISAVARMPPMTGMSRSIKMTSNRSARTASTAERPLTALVTLSGGEGRERPTITRVYSSSLTTHPRPGRGRLGGEDRCVARANRRADRGRRAVRRPAQAHGDGCASALRSCHLDVATLRSRHEPRRVRAEPGAAALAGGGVLVEEVLPHG